MKEFNSILEGINYIQYCPLCKHRLIIDHGEGNYDEYSQTLKYDFRDGKIEIDVVYGRILGYTIESRMNCNTVQTLGANQMYQYYGSSLSQGTTILGLGIGCHVCNQYSFMLQIILHLGPIKESCVDSIILNSETICLDEPGKSYEIKNIYTFPQTILTECGTEGDHSIEFPLIPLNLNSPKQTLKRLKDLILFS